jgi:hypothetical protein
MLWRRIIAERLAIKKVIALQLDVRLSVSLFPLYLYLSLSLSVSCLGFLFCFPIFCYAFSGICFGLLRAEEKSMPKLEIEPQISR